jgi:ribosomal protein S18 acetylase RimI-like enzyme
MILYRADRTLSVDEFVDLLKRSSLAERRPIQDSDCMGGMLSNADLLVTAWHDDLLVGVARSVTDFTFCCYLSDLAVDRAFQHSGIGRELIGHTQKRLGSRCAIILLAAPAAAEYYPHIGFTRHDSAWVLAPEGHQQAAKPEDR